MSSGGVLRFFAGIVCGRLLAHRRGIDAEARCELGWFRRHAGREVLA